MGMKHDELTAIMCFIAFDFVVQKNILDINITWYNIYDNVTKGGISNWQNQQQCIILPRHNDYDSFNTLDLPTQKLHL